MHIASGDLWAGAEVQLATLARALMKFPDISLSVVLLNHGKLEQELLSAGIDVTVFDESKLSSINIFLSLVRQMKKARPDIVHTHRIKENVLGSIAARISGVKHSVRTAHGAPEHDVSWKNPAKMAIKLLDIFCGRYLQQKIIAVSDDLAEILARNYPSNNIEVIQNGVDVNALNAIEKQAYSPTYQVGIVGRLMPVKRVDIFIQAAVYFLKLQPETNVTFHIYGDGPLYDELETMISANNVEKQIILEGHSSQIHQEIKNLDVLMMTSDHEGLPMTLLEAMALATPIIAHAVGGIPQLLENGNCGILVTDQTDKAYAEALSNLIKHNNDSLAKTNRAKKRVNEFYSAENNAERLRLVYRKISV